MKDFSKVTIKEINKGLLKKDFSALELTKYFINKIKEKKDKEDIFLEITEKLAQEQAEEVDKKIAGKQSVSLIAGLPIAIKDNIFVKEVKCTSGSTMMKNYTPLFDATVVKKLKKSEAIILGKTNMSEFGLDLFAKNSFQENSISPHYFDGTALAINEDMCIAALGTDVGGVIRQSVAYNNVIGLRPTYGSVSRYGLVSTASSLEQIGPLTKNVEDLEIIYKIILGYDSKDFTSREVIYKNQKDSTKLIIGVPKECFGEKVNSNVQDNFSKIVNLLKQQGFMIKEINLSFLDYASIIYFIIMSSEIFSGLAKFDGIRFGHSKFGKDLLDTYFESRGEGFGPELKKIMILGAHILSAKNYDILYKKAEKIRTSIKKDFQRIFKEVDTIITPVLSTYDSEIKEKSEKPSFMNSSNDFMSIVSLAGLPSISMSLKNDDDKLMGVQVIGDYFKEENIFKICKDFEKIWT